MVKRLRNEEVFVEHSHYARHNLKRRIINENLVEYKCSECGNNGTHNNKPLTLQLDHINGVSDDNRIENLRFLCPNCHTQTETYAGKASTGKRKYMKPPKRNYYENKLKDDKKLLDSLKNDANIRFGSWGWKSRFGKKIGICGQKVVPWLRRVDPDFLSKYE